MEDKNKEWHNIKWIMKIKPNNDNFIPDIEDYMDYAVRPKKESYDE